MQGLGLIAIGVVIGVAAATTVLILFGHKIATVVAAETKAVAYEASQLIGRESRNIRATVTTIEQRIHAKIDAWRNDAQRVDATAVRAVTDVADTVQNLGAPQGEKN